MRDAFPFLEVLTLPTDAGPNDDRVVIDGPNGTITGYVGSDVIFHLQAVAPASGRGIWATDFATSNAPADLDNVMRVRLFGGFASFNAQGVDEGSIRASNTSGLRIDGYQHSNSGSAITKRITLRGELSMDSVSGDDPIITIAETTDGFGTATFNHGMPRTPRIILPIAQSPAGMTVHNIDNYGSSTARIVTDQASTAITVPALVIT